MSRVYIESPIFNVCDELGYSFLHLTYHYYKDKTFVLLLSSFLKMSVIKASIATVLKHYRFAPIHSDIRIGEIMVERRSVIFSDYFISAPQYGLLTIEYIKDLEKNYKLKKGVIKLK